MSISINEASFVSAKPIESYADFKQRYVDQMLYQNPQLERSYVESFYDSQVKIYRESYNQATGGVTPTNRNEIISKFNDAATIYTGAVQSGILLSEEITKL